MLLLIAFLIGAPGNVLMAEGIDPSAGATPLPDAGKTIQSGLTMEAGQRAVDELYLTDVDKRITRIRPMATPIDQISRYAKTVKVNSMEVKYYAVGAKPIKTQLKTAVVKQTGGTSAKIEVEDAAMFDEDDTIRVVGVKGFEGGDPTKPSKEDLVLYVVGADDTTGYPTVIAVNGLSSGAGATEGGYTYLPDIPAGTKLVRMGKACGEVDAQTAVFSNIPTPEVQYCQNFMMQIEVSTFDKIAAKEVDWTFTDLEEDGVYDMRMGQEITYLFGKRGKAKNQRKKQTIWFTGGIWWMPEKDITVGVKNATTGAVEISDDELVDIAKSLFTGTGVGNKRKILFAGSNMLAAFSKIKSEKFRLKESVENWNLKFKSFDTDFGEVLLMHHELLDQCGQENEGFAIDPAFLTKYTYINWDRNELDLKSAGIRNTDAVVLQEVCCLALRYKKAHARLKLAS